MTGTEVVASVRQLTHANELTIRTFDAVLQALDLLEARVIQLEQRLPPPDGKQ